MDKPAAARELLAAKAREYGLHVALEHILTAVILTQREIETIQDTPQDRKRSVSSERQREIYQHERQAVGDELDGLIALCDLHQ